MVKKTRAKTGKKTFKMDIAIFREIWQYIKVANPDLALKVKGSIVRIICKNGGMPPEEWMT